MTGGSCVLEDLVDGNARMDAALKRLGGNLPRVRAEAEFLPDELLIEELLLATRMLFAHIGPSSAPDVVEAWAIARRAERAGLARRRRSDRLRKANAR